MNIENLSTLKIHKLTQEQYERELAAGRIDANALYLTPDEEGGEGGGASNTPEFVVEMNPTSVTATFVATKGQEREVTLTEFCLAMTENNRPAIGKALFILYGEEGVEPVGVTTEFSYISEGNNLVLCCTYPAPNGTRVYKWGASGYSYELVGASVSELQVNYAMGTNGTVTADRTYAEIIGAITNNCPVRAIMQTGSGLLSTTNANVDAAGNLIICFEGQELEKNMVALSKAIYLITHSPADGITLKMTSAYLPYSAGDAGVVNGIFTVRDGENGEPVYSWRHLDNLLNENKETIQALAQENLPAWSKAENKPAYTAAEVGADTSGTANSAVAAHNTSAGAHSDIRGLITNLTNRLNEWETVDGESSVYVGDGNTPHVNWMEAYAAGKVCAMRADKFTEATLFLTGIGAENKLIFNGVCGDNSLVTLYLSADGTADVQSIDVQDVVSEVNNKADKTEGAFYIVGSGTTDSTAKTSTWVGTSDRITEYYDGLAIRYKIGVAGQTTTTLNINNLGAKPIYLFNTTKVTTQFPVNSIINLIYHADLNSGCWMCSDYDSNTNTYQRVYATTSNVEYPITARYNTTTGSSYYAEYGRYSTGVTLNPSTNTITATKFKGALSGNADTATKATQDASGNVIAATYETKANVESKLGAVNEQIVNLENGTATVINLKEKYNLDNTGSADCSTLINQAIAEASKDDTLYLPNGTYRLNSTVTVNKSINLQFEGVVKYYGTDFAFLIKNFNHSTAKFNEIRASSGSCIKLYSNWTGESNFIQYSHFIFQKLVAKQKSAGGTDSYCILAQSENGGWINENRFTGGKMESGHYGFYTDCGDHDNFNGNLFDSCAAEGETDDASKSLGVGFYLANGCRNNMLFRCRHSESFEKFLVTVGLCYGLKIISTSAFDMSQNIVSENTTGFVMASLPVQSGARCETKATFVRGTLVCENHDNTKYLSTAPAGVFDMTNLLSYAEEYNNFVVGGNCSGIKLNKKYGYIDGINEFYVRFPNAGTATFQITDWDGNVLNYVPPKTANSVVKFNWFSETGWQYSYDFSNADQVKDLVNITDYARNDEVVKTVNNAYPDENGNIEIVVVEEEPIVVGSIEECIDTTKKYVLPDGYIYAYRKRFYPSTTTPNFTNQLPISRSLDMSDTIFNGVGYKYGTTSTKFVNGGLVEYDFSSSGFELYSLGLIPIKIGDVVRVNQIGCRKEQGNDHPLFGIVQASLGYGKMLFYQNGVMEAALSRGLKYTVEDVNEYYVIYRDVEIPINSTLLTWIADEPIGWLICNFSSHIPPEDIVITVNEEITYTITEDRYESKWENTGKLYDESGYSDMINALEERVEILENNSGTSLTTETWTFTLEDGSTVTKAVCVK